MIVLSSIWLTASARALLVRAVTMSASCHSSSSLLLPIPTDPSYIYPKSSFPSKSKFESTTIYPALIIPAQRTSEIRKHLISLLLHRPKIKNVVKLDEKEGGLEHERKLILKTKDDAKIQDLLTNNSAIKLSNYELKLGYQDLSVDEVLKMILPLDEIPSAFETVGHIAHLNLRDVQLPYKYIIGQVILDKNQPRITMVVNKIGSVSGAFRTFPMEVLASSSQESFDVEVKEEKCRFQFNFKDVYWNSRLMGEHQRIVQLIGSSNKISKKRKLDQPPNNEKIIVADAFAGVGPFAVPLTSSSYSNIHVYANDLNPLSFKALEHNAQLNKCSNLKLFNLDGRVFLQSLEESPDFVIMNLPADAPEFLDAFRGWGFESDKAPIVLVHCFAEKNVEMKKGDDPCVVYGKAIERCEAALGCKLDITDNEVKVHVARDISPNKNMLCISFRLPKDVGSLDKIEF